MGKKETEYQKRRALVDGRQRGDYKKRATIEQLQRDIGDMVGNETDDPDRIQKQRSLEQFQVDEVYSLGRDRKRRMSIEEVEHRDKGCAFADWRVAEGVVKDVAYADIGEIFWPDIDSATAGRRLSDHWKDLQRDLENGNGLRASAYRGARSGLVNITKGKVADVLPPWAGCDTAMEAAQKYMDSRK